MGYLETSIVNILTQLAVIEREIVDPATGAPFTAYDNVPYAINTADMPLFINLIGPLINAQAMGSDEDGRERLETRIYKLAFYLAPFSTGIEGEKYGQLALLYEYIFTGLGKYPHLKGLYGVIDCQIIADTGAKGDLEFMGNRYFGIQYSAQITTRVRRPLDQLE